MILPPSRLDHPELGGTPDPAEVVTVTLGRRTFRAGRRTAAHLEWTIAQLAVDYPKATLVVLQPCYNRGVELSAGTHDYDGVLDVWITGLSGEAAELWLRKHGWEAWFRHTGSWSSRGAWHVHMVSAGCPGPVGQYVPGQDRDYRATPPRTGLVGHAVDPTPHPPLRPFDYPAYLEATDMTPAQVAQLQRVEDKLDAQAVQLEKLDAALRRITKSKHEVLDAVERAK